MPDLHDTQPNRNSILLGQNDGLQAPPRILFWGVIILFVLVIVGGFGSLYVFREVLQPSQQQRIIDQLHFMRAFLKPTPAGGVFPTVEPANETDAMSLLDMPLNIPSPTPTVSAQSVLNTSLEITQEVEVLIHYRQLVRHNEDTDADDQNSAHNLQRPKVLLEATIEGEKLIEAQTCKQEWDTQAQRVDGKQEHALHNRVLLTCKTENRAQDGTNAG